jgi:cell division protein FtsZ
MEPMTVRPESTNVLHPQPRPLPVVEPPAVDTVDLLIGEERPSDADLIRRTVDMFVKNFHTTADLDKPTFERNKTILYTMPLLPEHDYVRSKLNE